MRILLISLVFLLHCTAALAAEEAQQKTQIWEDGTKYIGAVVNGKREGKGTIIWSDGSRYVGYFKNDLRNGSGTMILPDGSVFNGYFVDDELTDAPASKTDEEVVVVMAPAKPDAETPQPKAEPQPTITEAVVATPSATSVASVNLQMDDATATKLRDTLDSWAKAWSQQDSASYLATYDDEFSVPGRLSRNQWEGLRRSRIKRPKTIDVSLQFESLQLTSNHNAEVRVKQAYRSNLYKDSTRKLFLLKRHDSGEWKILSEKVLN